MLKVAILGCGPSGLLAAHAAQINGAHFDVYSEKRKSMLAGAQYLHEPIPGITKMPETVEYRLEGTPEEYRRKVYGTKWDGNVSPEDLEESHQAWDIRDAYIELWNRYNGDIHDCIFDPQTPKSDLWEQYDVVISTVPRRIWATESCRFESTRIYAVGDAPELGQVVPFTIQEDNTIICNADPIPTWYRLSKVFGFTTIEWPGHFARPPVDGVRMITKPLRCESNAAPDFVHMGRYGEWKKGVLTTDVFNQALKATATERVVV